MGPTISGATPAQEALLGDILSGLDAPRIRKIEVHPYEPTFEEHIEFGLEPPPGPHGDEIVVWCEDDSMRSRWEADLLAVAFKHRSDADSLEQVAATMVFNARGVFEEGRSLEFEIDHPVGRLLDARQLEELPAAVAEATGSGTVERLEVLRPHGHAIAVTVRTDEPHSFLRNYVSGLLGAPWRTEVDGSYVEVRDGRPDPVLVGGRVLFSGMATSRLDVACCTPFSSNALFAPPRPSCPVFDG